MCIQYTQQQPPCFLATYLPSSCTLWTMQTDGYIFPQQPRSILRRSMIRFHHRPHVQVEPNTDGAADKERFVWPSVAFSTICKRYANPLSFFCSRNTTNTTHASGKKCQIRVVCSKGAFELKWWHLKDVFTHIAITPLRMYWQTKTTFYIKIQYFHHKRTTFGTQFLRRKQSAKKWYEARTQW